MQSDTWAPKYMKSSQISREELFGNGLFICYTQYLRDFRSIPTGGGALPFSSAHHHQPKWRIRYSDQQQLYWGGGGERSVCKLADRPRRC